MRSIYLFPTRPLTWFGAKTSLELFDNWLAPSVGLRQYLWAHRRESIETARKLIELISPVVLKTVLGYLVLNYWGHRSGWPDLLVYRTNQWFLAEVKSCSDKLNENQKRWIEDNHRYLHLPFKLVQVHRMEANVSASAVGSRAGPRDRIDRATMLRTISAE